jgi:PAS domain S-box-containing protein
MLSPTRFRKVEWRSSTSEIMMSTSEIIQIVVGSLLIAGIVAWLVAVLYSPNRRQLVDYHRVFELSPEMILLLHPVTGRIVEVNERVQELTGYPPEALKGRPIMEWPNLPEASKQSTLQHLRKRTGGERVPPYEMEIQTQAGKRLVGRVHVAQLTDRRGRIKADMLSIYDITEQKLAEERLQQILGETEKFNRLMVGREMRVVELKKEVNALLLQAGRSPVYPIGKTNALPSGAKAASSPQAAILPEQPA